nr:hypothetical protein Iba_scaffold1676888CG0010 [Ipomoea batatas]
MKQVTVSTSLYKSIPELFRQNAAAMFHINSLENPELLGELVVRLDLHRGQALLDLGVIQVASIVGIEETEEAPDSNVPLFLSLLESCEHVVHGDRAGLLNRIAASGPVLCSHCWEIDMPYGLSSPRHGRQKSGSFTTTCTEEEEDANSQI